MKEEQLKLFKMLERLYRKARGPLYYVEIIEKGGKKYIIYIRTFNLCEIKKLAKIEYNNKHGYDSENDLKFGKIKEMKEMKEVKCRTKKCWETDLQANKADKYKIKKERKDEMKKEKEMTESEKKRCGCYFKPKAEIQRQEIIKNLNKTSENEKLIRLKWKERR